MSNDWDYDAPDYEEPLYDDAELDIAYSYGELPELSPGEIATLAVVTQTSGGKDACKTVAIMYETRTGATQDQAFRKILEFIAANSS